MGGKTHRLSPIAALGLQYPRICNVLLEVLFLKRLLPMSIGPTQQRAIPDAAVLGTRPVPRWSRPLAVATASIFCVSTAFPVVAGLSKNTGAFPKWWGIADVTVAFFLAAMALAVMAAAQGRISKQADEDTYRA